jgi:predicted glycoside hydrolase/deacetylase ChbG (UPF0249 family)
MMSQANRSTNDLLGYPADARLLIINCDDFGMCHSVSAATLDALRRGVATSATLMTPCPWAMHAMQILREHPQFPFGVHLTLVSEHAGYRWGPVSSRDRVPSLTDESGHFYAHDRIPALLAGARIEDVEREFRAQIGTVLTANLQPTHLDFHCVADGGRADIFDLALGLAREFGLALRVHGRANAARCRRQGLPANDHPVLDSYHLEAVDKTARYLELLRALPPGLTEWAVHPSLGNAEARAIEPDSWQIRRADYDFLVSLDARAVLDEEKITLLDYRALQAVWFRQ